ncbi:hypothetical protein Zmor_008957 [Zophobas morio]|uniref:Uncharacterized protein n=1 Tax=Zophobas morio TaxID=2755281 RepID=A0AA38HIE2_9CUCU|nr:hypothetical protein Zmor_008957 [Zophobas morio]
MKRDEIASEVSRPNADDLKFYQVVTSEMLDRYKKAEPKVEVINDGEKVKADTSTNKQESNYNQGGFAGAGPGIGGNPFVNNGMPQNPMANDRFYPYRTKPKYTRILRYVIAGLALLFGVFTVIVFVLSVLSSRTTTLDELMKNIPGYNDTFKVDTDTYSVGSFVLGAGIKVKDFSFYSGIIFTLLYLGVIG